ncbi:MAG TPA: radical SAM protein [Candidatus Wallbacteria bacterium]|nr:radical SAM protein [Candidatus Wallbacteria bacterium]
MYNIILINPPVYDFTYFNLWEKPLGLLNLASAFVADERCRVHFIDCVPERLKKKSEYDRGAGKLTGVRTDKPECFKTIKRNFHRYGIGIGELEERLLKIKSGIKPGEPSAVLIGAMMTYWYMGAFEAAAAARRVMPQAAVALGGIYARLAPEHAGRSGLFDYIETGFDVFAIRENILKILNVTAPGCGRSCGSLIPAYHLLEELNNSVSLATSTGCPYRCSYCASGVLYPRYSVKPAAAIVEELSYYKTALGVKNAAFYDDALLYKKEENFYRWADEWIKTGGGIDFHLPNAAHASMIDEKCAAVMKAAGFKTVRLGYEFYDKKKQDAASGGKVSGAVLKRAVANLKKEGFNAGDIGVYILFGHPACDIVETANAVDFVFDCGATPGLSLYSPIPRTPDAEAVFAQNPEILSEPLLQNKTVFFQLYSGIDYGQYYDLKTRIQRLRSAG